MSIEREAVIIRGFYFDGDPYNYFSDDFIDEWVICFDGWSGGPYFVGYYITTCKEGRAFDLERIMNNSYSIGDKKLRNACWNIGFEPRPIKAYFGMRVY